MILGNVTKSVKLPFLWIIAGYFESPCMSVPCSVDRVGYAVMLLGVARHDGASKPKRVCKKFVVSMIVAIVENICLLHHGMFLLCWCVGDARICNVSKMAYQNLDSPVNHILSLSMRELQQLEMLLLG